MTAPSERQVNILIVDDRQENIIALEAILGDMGYTIVTAHSGHEVLRAVLEQEFAVILLDVRMPDMDGFETATLLRQREQTLHTPIIFLTAGDNSSEKVFRGYSVGAVDYMSKPFDPVILRTKVGVFVELYQKSLQLQMLNQDLEHRVEERTQQLQETNRELTREVAERRKAEGEVRALNTDLENRVRERTAELEIANEELRSFSYSVSHDLRAPLRKIEAFSRMLVEEHADGLDKGGHEYLKRICVACKRMEELIDDVLKLSQITGSEMTREQVNLSGIAHDIAADLQQSDPDRRAVFQIQDGIRAHGDRRLIRLALQNLMDNAWKFTSKEPEARIEFGVNLNGKPVYFVKDNGVGFDNAHRAKLFTPFARLHKSTEFPGTGIGLAIVQRVIQRHGGTVSADSEKGGGATFSFTL
ncbi:MAG TPA: response regulator [Rhodothermales bacterium]|nr:response regulator [Rhodothermales bacterium]